MSDELNKSHNKKLYKAIYSAGDYYEARKIAFVPADIEEKVLSYGNKIKASLNRLNFGESGELLSELMAVVEGCVDDMPLSKLDSLFHPSNVEENSDD